METLFFTFDQEKRQTTERRAPKGEGGGLFLTRVGRRVALRSSVQFVFCFCLFYNRWLSSSRKAGEANT